ncbi:MAG: hypothetical protein ACI379_10910 [Nocardioides sp.]|uniref:hypothetical protein n=1 Tax=Nocardioides sp. TaxID=35761 RepID=UPI003F0C4049
MERLAERLTELAAGAPGGGGTDEIWTRGVRRARRRRTAAAAATVAVVAVVALLVPWVGDREGPQPVSELVVPALPTRVNAPGAWSEATGPDGPVAAIGVATRAHPMGITDSRPDMELFTVSAIDGRATWTDLPDIRRGQQVYTFAVSPDGTQIGWTFLDKQAPRDRRVGWAVMDTATREVTRFEPRFPKRAAYDGELAFSGDSRHLLASYVQGADQEHQAHLLALDVQTGEAVDLTPEGTRWNPLGSAPTGVVRLAGDTVVRTDPATGEESTDTLPGDVIDASWSPTEGSFAWIRDGATGNDPYVLWVGDSPERTRPMPLEFDDGYEPRQLLGWVDDQHVVVGHWRTWVHVVDVTTGEFDRLEIRGEGDIFNPPNLANDLWSAPLREPVAREGTSDPRRPYLWGGGALLVAAVAGILWWRRRRRA